jgi:hypothetical protein
MNEQLQEFYRQAIQSTNSDEHLDMPNKQVQRLILTKYAELIVKECADVVRYYYIRGGEPITPQHIRKHFGVEE